MFDRLGRVAVGHRKLVLTLTMLVVIACGVVGFHVFDVLRVGGMDDPGSESSRAERLVQDKYGGEAEMVFLVTAKDGNVESPATRDAANALNDRMRQDPRLEFPFSYWQSNIPQTRSLDQSSALITARVAEKTLPMVQSVVHDYQGSQGAVDVSVGGAATVEIDAQEQTERDLLLAESAVIPLLAVLLFVVFGSLVSSLLPVLVAGITIAVTLAALTGVGSITNVTAYSINLATAMGLGLAIDYGLLMVSRYREELAAGKPTPVAVIDAVRSAGRTITFSAGTVLVAMAALLIFPQPFLRSFAYTGIIVAVLSGVVSVLILPAMLAALGPKVEMLRLPGRKGRQHTTKSRFWGRVAGRAYRRPVLAVPVLVVLLLAAVPLFSVNLGIPDERMIPASRSSAQVGDVLRVEYDGTSRATILLSGPAEDRGIPALTEYARALARVPGVTGVSSSAGNFTADMGPLDFPIQSELRRPGYDMLLLTFDAEARSTQGEALTQALRALPPPPGTEKLVTGDSAIQLDTKTSTANHLPVVGGVIVITTFLLLFLFTGSPLQPVRSLLLNMVGLSATIGLMVLVFQEGFGSSVLGVTPAPLETSALLLLFVVAFGLSMDYEIFVISRIKEARDRGANLRDTVVDGLSRTGRIITAAAMLLAVSMMALVAGGVSFLKMIGLGIALSILVDSTLIRGVLLPASLRLMGRWAWWAPPWLTAVHRRIGISESAVERSPRPGPAAEAAPEPEPVGAGPGGRH